MSFGQVVVNRINDLITERDGQTWCPARIIWILGVIVYLVFTGYTVIHGQGHVFDYTSFATGFSTILAAGAAAVRIKLDSEQPIPRDDQHHDDGGQR